ncbi:hypothetical protein JZ751_002486 [Albula glossodonta]|uniref:Uncharacterized protein n=1 Tax=Albula glossodonta TaxID=121402 RepID=A0A8T2N702_9TELE|nr:hypothetical protein JZ751_002486 [Albula glossodonta]
MVLHSYHSSSMDENWDDDQLLGFEPCNENLITGCNIIDGKCECDSLRTCNNPFEFPSQGACQAALQKIEACSCHPLQSKRRTESKNYKRVYCSEAEAYYGGVTGEFEQLATPTPIPDSGGRS